jgi:intracellular multiplication protein IcmV
MAEEKVKKKGFFKRSVVYLFDFRKGANVDAIKANAQFIGSTFKELYRKPTTENTALALGIKTFDDFMQRFQLSEADIQARCRTHFRMFLAYFMCFCGFLAYTIYFIMVSNKIMAAFAALAITSVMLTYAIREHYWYMQMKIRKVGCTFREWVSFIFKKRG